MLGFFVVGDSAISLVIEWLFCIFTTLQGLMIFLMHCVLNKEVRGRGGGKGRSQEGVREGRGEGEGEVTAPGEGGERGEGCEGERK